MAATLLPLVVSERGQHHAHDHESFVDGAETSAPFPRGPGHHRTALETALERLRLRELDVEYDGDRGILWAMFRFPGRPSFTRALLDDINSVQTMLRTTLAGIDAAAMPMRYLVWGSRMPGIWNLGGDLSLFAALIRSQDRATLRHYAYQVIGEGFHNTNALDLPIITVSLIQGDALGGGFEAALSSNLLIAERGARFGLPEILFSLFPGMGAYSFLARRIAPAMAERIIRGGELYTATALHEMGVIDILCEDGTARETFLSYVTRYRRRHHAHRAIVRARQLVHPLPLREMTAIGDLWVDAALALTEPDLRKMERLAAVQRRNRAAANF